MNLFAIYVFALPFIVFGLCYGVVLLAEAEAKGDSGSDRDASRPLGPRRWFHQKVTVAKRRK